MLEPFDPQLHPIQDNSQIAHKTTHSLLKLVVSNPLPVQEMFPSQTMNSNTGFTAEVRMRGPSLYSLVARDPSHYLDCELILEIQEKEDEDDLEPAVVICHFPNISDEKLNDFVWEDETLLGMVLIQFQMKILEQLLLFCLAHYASKLLIYTDDAQAEELGIYREFLLYEGQALLQNGEQTEIMIPANKQAFDNWIDFMDKVTIKFRQTLWQDQRKNPAIRQYLKSHPLG